jgi:hypothetical protein
VAKIEFAAGDFSLGIAAIPAIMCDIMQSIYEGRFLRVGTTVWPNGPATLAGPSVYTARSIQLLEPRTMRMDGSSSPNANPAGILGAIAICNVSSRPLATTSRAIEIPRPILRTHHPQLGGRPCLQYTSHAILGLRRAPERLFAH